MPGFWGERKPDREPTRNLEIKLCSSEIKRVVQAMGAMGVEVPDANSAFYEAAVTGLQILLAIKKDNCLNPLSEKSLIAIRPPGEREYRWKDWDIGEVVKAIIPRKKTDISATFSVFEADFPSLDNLFIRLRPFLITQGVVKDWKSPPNYSLLFRMGANLVVRIVEFTQKEGGDPRKPIELSWGDDNTLYGDSFRGRYYGIALVRGELRPTPRFWLRELVEDLKA